MSIQSLVLSLKPHSKVPNSSILAFTTLFHSRFSFAGPYFNEDKNLGFRD